MTSHGKYAINPPPRRSEPRGALQRGEKFAQRISHILALLHQGGDVDKKQLAAHFGVGVRTLEGRWQLTAAARIHPPTQQLLPVVRDWMPHLRIVQPGAWEQRLLDELRQTLASQFFPLSLACRVGATPVFALHWVATVACPPIQNAMGIYIITGSISRHSKSNA